VVELEVGMSVLVQEVWRDRLWCARPFVVVHHDSALSALWMPAGALFKGPSNPRNRTLKATPRERMLDNLRFVDWGHRDVVAPMSSLWLVPHGAWYSAQRAWPTDGTRLGWYVNFQEPLRQLPNALRTMDLALDLVVDLDGTQHLKDEADFETLCDEGLISEEASAAVRRASAAARLRLTDKSPPFDEVWETFEPDWTIPAPTLPDGWDVIDPLD
jgi:hypothetical protein